MHKLNFITVVGIVAAFSIAVEMASPAIGAFAAQPENMTMNMYDNIISMVNMTGGGNATSMAGNMTEIESLPSANQTGLIGSTAGTLALID